MKIWRWIPVIFAFLIGNGCQSQLERPGVPIWGGLNIEAGCSREELKGNLAAAQKFGLQGWVFEIPFEILPGNDPVRFRFYERYAIDTLVRLMEVQQTPYALQFSLRNLVALSTSQLDPNSYFTDISGILLRTQSYPPDLIIFEGDWIKGGDLQLAVQEFSAVIRRDFTPFKGEIVLSGRPQDLFGAFDWSAPDVVGISYDRPPGEGRETYRAYFRETNQRIADSLGRYAKPAMIVQTNLLGSDPDLLFKNQLRFWPDSIELRGAVINGNDCQLPLLKAEGRFSLALERELQKFLQAYTP